MTRSLAAAFGIWVAAVAPVNSLIGDVLRTAPESVPATWMGLRGRWELGHAAGLVMQLVGLCALLIAVLVETPRHP